MLTVSVWNRHPSGTKIAASVGRQSQNRLESTGAVRLSQLVRVYGRRRPTVRRQRQIAEGVATLRHRQEQKNVGSGTYAGGIRE